MKTANLAIVFTDIKGFTERTSQQTLEQNQKLLATHDALLMPVFKAFDGRVVKKIGDAFLVTFESPTAAVLAGVAAQDKLWQHNQTTTPETRLDVRIAINVGEVRVENGDVFGEPVNIAARIEGVAEAGEVTFTEAVYLSMNKAEVPAEEIGSFELKGIPGKVRAYRVPRAPYRVEASGAASEGPPFGNLGLSKMPERPELATKAAEIATDVAQRAARGGGKLMSATAGLVGAMRDSQGPKNKRALMVGAAGAVTLLAVLAVFALSASPLDRAMRDIANSTGAERTRRVANARKMIADIQKPYLHTYWQGRILEAESDPGAAAQYVQAIKQGYGAAESDLARLLTNPKCKVRVAALDGISNLHVTSARSAVQKLADNGAPGDGERVFITTCDSQSEAKQTLKDLDE